MSELGPLRIGQNLTEFAWDGTDQFGDRLANGVYFYRVISKIDGQTVENRASGADRFFSREFGKMYLMK
jgi:flagellar hook assembly protein FlgD